MGGVDKSGNSAGESGPGFDRVDAAHGGIVELGYDLETGGLREARNGGPAPPSSRVGVCGGGPTGRDVVQRENDDA